MHCKEIYELLGKGLESRSACALLKALLGSESLGSRALTGYLDRQPDGALQRQLKNKKIKEFIRFNQFIVIMPLVDRLIRFSLGKKKWKHALPPADIRGGRDKPRTSQLAAYFKDVGIVNKSLFSWDNLRKQWKPLSAWHAVKTSILTLRADLYEVKLLTRLGRLRLKPLQTTASEEHKNMGEFLF